MGEGASGPPVREDAGNRVAPQPEGRHAISLRERVARLVVERRRHVVAEVAAELDREQPQQRTKEALRSGHRFTVRSR